MHLSLQFSLLLDFAMVRGLLGRNIPHVLYEAMQSYINPYNKKNSGFILTSNYMLMGLGFSCHC